MENSPTIKAMDNLTDAANKMAVALESGDLPTVTECLNRSRRNHYALHESCDSETLREFFRTLESHILGGKTCGAGGGGFIMVVARPNQRKRCIQLAEQLGGKALNFIFDHRGVVDWCEPSSTPQELQALRDAIESGGPL
jgi:D-glycero-alpha-D-manno-heptose-7-phosphate kinase